ncbi:hypothetical protein P3T36_007386 [Kitasatospora sp. MAP12-15]|nr:hypothetical protein [Kitasatospora sp. MAP12-44]
MDTLAQEPEGRHHESGLLDGLADSSILGRLATLDLASRELPRELALTDPASHHRHTALVHHDRGGNTRPLLGSLLCHVCSSRAARMGEKSVSAKMKRVTEFRGTRIISTFSTVSLLVEECQLEVRPPDVSG